MKRILSIFFLGVLFASPAFAEEINSYDVVVNVSDRGSLSVRENISMDFGELERHGVIRVIPETFSRGDQLFALRISDVDVKSDDEVSFSVSQEDGLVLVKIGDDDVVVSGSVNYVLTYKVDGAVVYGENGDDLVWDAVGTQWAFPISNVRALYQFHKPISRNRISFDCGVGVDQNCTSVAVKDIGGGLLSEVVFTQDSIVESDGMFNRMSFSKGFLSEPRPAEVFLNRLKDNWYMIFAGIVVIVAVDVWRRRRNIEVDVDENVS